MVGFGAAGASAAIEAARAGAHVTLFEATSGNGGTSALSGGEIYLGGGGGTPIQRAAGFDDRTEDLYKYLLMAGGPNADEAKVRLYADGSLAHYEWLTAQGVEYRNSYIAERYDRALDRRLPDLVGQRGGLAVRERGAPGAARPLPEVRRHGRRALRDGRAGPARRRAGRGCALRPSRPGPRHRRCTSRARPGTACRRGNAVRPCAQGCRALHGRLRHEPRDGPASRALDAALEFPDRHRRRRLRHPPRCKRRRRGDQHGRGIRHAALVSARLAGQGNIRQRARPALRKRGLLSRARVAVHPAATRRSHLAAGRCRVVSADGVPGAFARRDRRRRRDLGGSGDASWAARALARRDRRALQPQRRAWRGPALSQGKTLAGAAREAAVRRARLPHRSLLLFELHPGRSRHLAYGRSARPRIAPWFPGFTPRAAQPAVCHAGVAGTARACRSRMLRSSGGRRERRPQEPDPELRGSGALRPAPRSHREARQPCEQQRQGGKRRACHERRGRTYPIPEQSRQDTGNHQ